MQILDNAFGLVLFDLDGTLVDTAPDSLAYLNEMLAELGRPGLGLEAVRPMIGDGVKRLMIRGLEASAKIDCSDQRRESETYREETPAQSPGKVYGLGSAAGRRATRPIAGQG